MNYAQFGKHKLIKFSPYLDIIDNTCDKVAGEDALVDLQDKYIAKISKNNVTVSGTISELFENNGLKC